MSRSVRTFGDDRTREDPWGIMGLTSRTFDCVPAQSLALTKAVGEEIDSDRTSFVKELRSRGTDHFGGMPVDHRSSRDLSRSAGSIRTNRQFF